MRKRYDKKVENAKELINNKDINLAYKKLRKLHKINPRDNVVKFELAKIMYIMGEEKLDIAEKYFTEIYNYNHYSTAKLYLGKILLLKGEMERAIKILNELINTESEAEALIHLGKIAEDCGKKHIARKYYEEARKSIKSKNNATLQLGILERREGNIELAEKLFKSIEEEKYKSKAKKELKKIHVKSKKI